MIPSLLLPATLFPVETPVRKGKTLTKTRAQAGTDPRTSAAVRKPHASSAGAPSQPPAHRGSSFLTPMRKNPAQPQNHDSGTLGKSLPPLTPVWVLLKLPLHLPSPHGVDAIHSSVAVAALWEHAVPNAALGRVSFSSLLPYNPQER